MADLRTDMCHAKYYALLEKKRFIAPIAENPQRILDLGCGTGKQFFALGVTHVAPMPRFRN
jgi:ubiquinone/menaquinone biosynthesis C-methylase UbiE